MTAVVTEPYMAVALVIDESLLIATRRDGECSIVFAEDTAECTREKDDVAAVTSLSVLTQLVCH